VALDLLDYLKHVWQTFYKFCSADGLSSYRDGRKAYARRGIAMNRAKGKPRVEGAARRRLTRSLALIFFFFCWQAPAALTQENKACLKCHGTRNILSLSKEQRLAIVVPSPGKQGGKKGNLGLYVDEGQFRATAHRALSCTDCHTDIKGIPHAQRLETVRCVQCHQEIADDYEQDLRATGSSMPCSECHDPHATTSCKNNASRQPKGSCLPYHTIAGHRGPLPSRRGYPWLDGIGIVCIIASLGFVGAHTMVRLINRKMRRRH
jgi:hypothetical protein